MSGLGGLFPKSYLLSSDYLHNFPAYFSVVLVKTFQIWAYVSDNFSSLIFLN